MSSFLNIYHILVIWVQGCLKNCEGCISPQGRPLDVNQLVSVETLAQSIISNKHIDGITISGGEPFLQATNLTLLLRTVREKRPELNVLVFTGYTIEELNTEKALALMKCIDLLIDGPFIAALNDEKGLRGSSNQRLHFLTDRLLPYQEELENGSRNNDIIIGNDGTYIIGIPRKDIKL